MFLRSLSYKAIYSNQAWKFFKKWKQYLLFSGRVLVKEFKISKFDDMLCNLALICPVAFEDMCIYVHTFSEWLFLIATRSTSSMKWNSKKSFL